MRLASTRCGVRAVQNARLSVRRGHFATRALEVEAYPIRSSGENILNPFRVIEQREDTRWTARTRRNQSVLAEQHADEKQFSTHIPFEEHLLNQRKHNQIIKAGDEAGILISNQPYVFDDQSNISQSILGMLDRRLYAQPDHPISITRKLIESVFPAPQFENHIAINPVVTTFDNFDALDFPKDHPGRSRTDTYYVNREHVLRTHTSAHQLSAFGRLAGTRYIKDPSLQNTPSGYTICADVFRRDSIDRSHMPVFHQMEAARIWSTELHRGEANGESGLVRRRIERMQKDLQEIPNHGLKVEDDSPAYNEETNPKQGEHSPEEVDLMVQHLKRSLETLVAKVFTAAREAGMGADGTAANEPLKVRWIEAYFPFTAPSYELEVWWQGEWLELLGCGIVKQGLLTNAGCADKIGWAWGIGIERLAMLLFGIPDIRLFWSQDPRFLGQFKGGRINKFESFSKYPACYKDVAFWIKPSPAAATPIADAEVKASAAAAAGGNATKANPAEIQPGAFHENDVMEIVRDIAGNLAEDVKLVDEFVHPRTGRKSLCYRINYRSLEGTLTNDEVNKMHNEVTARLVQDLNVELR